MTPEALLFALFAILSIVSAGMVILLRDPVKAAMSLIVCFFCIACLYLLQSAELIAVLEVLVYAGAIMVLFVFVIMLVEHKDDPIFGTQFNQRIAVPLKFAAVLAVTVRFLTVIHNGASTVLETLPTGFGSVKAIGRAFYSDFLFQFEFTSVLLMVGIVGAVVLSRHAKSDPKDERLKTPGPNGRKAHPQRTGV